MSVQAAERPSARYFRADDEELDRASVSSFYDDEIAEAIDAFRAASD